MEKHDFPRGAGPETYIWKLTLDSCSSVDFYILASF